MTDKNYEILEHIAVLSENASGWKKELILTKWFDNEPKYDIRDWSSDYGKCGKGITFSNEEMNVLMECKSKLEEEMQIWYIGYETIVFGDGLELQRLQCQLLYY